MHHSQPRIVTITQSTENGRVWTVPAIAEFVDHAHALDLLVHVDGSRIANAIAALDVSPSEAIGDADIVTVGGTKNGMLFGDAVLVRRPEHFSGIHFVQKQIGHLASKHRFVAAQFLALLEDGLWLDTAAHANAMARRLSTGMTALGFQLASPVDANEVFVNSTRKPTPRLPNAMPSTPRTRWCRSTASCALGPRRIRTSMRSWICCPQQTCNTLSFGVTLPACRPNTGATPSPRPRTSVAP